MRRPLQSLVLDTGIAQSRKVDSFKEALARAEQDRGDGDVHFIDEAVAQLLLNDIDATTKANVFFCRSLSGRFQCDGDAFGHKIISRTAFHYQRCAWESPNHATNCHRLP